MYLTDLKQAHVGMGIRGSIGQTLTYRMRRGNGYYNSKAGHVYQDQYEYFVPGSINNVQSEPYRRQWIAAVHKWRYDLTDAQKKAYNDIANHGLHMTGFNLFMRKAMKGEIDMFVDRGDPATYDYDKTDLTIDGAWHTLDLSSIVPAGAAGVLLKTRLQSANPGDTIMYRKNGNANEINACGCEALRANVIRTRMGFSAIDSNRIMEYKADNIAWTLLDIAVRGWWT